MLAPVNQPQYPTTFRSKSVADRTLFADPQPIASYVEDVRVFYRYCEYFFTNTIVGTAITKLAQFAVDGLTVKSESEEAEREAQRIVRKIRLKENLVRGIRDYQLYGIFILYPMYRLRKTLKCPACSTIYRLDDLHKDNIAQYRRDDKGDYYYKCQAKICKNFDKEALFTFTEKSLANADNIQIALWSPNRISVSHNMVTGDKQYAYDLDPELKRKVQQNDHFIMCTLPEVFIQAAKKDKKVRITQNKIFVYEAPTLQIHGLPIPPMARIFYELGLRLKYMAANKTIAEDTLIPLRILFPVERGTVAGPPLAQTIDMKTWVDSVYEELEKFKRDKTYVPVMPIEVGTTSIWGDGKLLGTDQELRANMQDIMAGLGIPIEFMYGGATWSRQNVSAMVLQNVIKMLVDAAQDTVSFVEDKINQNKTESEKVELKLNVPELVEAFSKLAYLAQEHEKGGISSETYYKHLGEDYSTEQRYKKRELDQYADVKKMIAQEQGQMQYETTKATLSLQADQREIARKETLKDSLAQAAVERDAQEAQIKTQTRQQLIQMKLQAMAEERQMAQQQIMADQQMRQQMETMKLQLKLQEKSQLRMGKKQMEQQLDGMKQQAVAELEAQDAAEQYQMNKQMEQAYASMPPEQQQEIQQLPPEQQQAKIQEYMQQMSYEQAAQSLDPEQQEQYQQTPDEEKQAFLDQVMAEQQQEAMSQDPNYMKQQMEESAKNDPKKIQEKANVYNRLTPEQRVSYEAEMMQEDTDIYAKVKELADQMASYEYVAKLINAEPEQADMLWREITATRPEITDDVYSQIEQQLLYMDQAAKYAMQLHALKDNAGEWKKMFDEINANSPEEFRKMIYTEYSKIVSGQKEKEKADFQLNTYAQSVAGSMAAMTDSERNNLLLNIKTESPDLYAKVMKSYMDMDLAGQVNTIQEPGQPGA